MHIDRVVARQVVAELANRLQERHRLDIADRAADLAQYEVIVVIAVQHEMLDLVGDVRDHLNGRAEIVAAPLALDDVLVDAAGGDVVLLVRGTPGEPLVMAEIEVGLGAVIGHEHFAVLVRRHRSGVDIEVGVELFDPRAIASRLQESPKSCCGDAFSE